MTPEERFDKLTERVDAIARNLELLSGMQIETERKLQSLIDSTKQFEETINRGMDQTACILRNHEQRINALEGK